MGLMKAHQWARGPWSGGIYLDYCRKCGQPWHAVKATIICPMRMSNRALKNLRRQTPRSTR